MDEQCNQTIEKRAKKLIRLLVLEGIDVNDIIANSNELEFYQNVMKWIKNNKTLLNKKTKHPSEQIDTYRGMEGLKQAMAELSCFYAIHNRVPKYNDQGMAVIYSTINLGEWQKNGVRHWSDMLQLTFVKNKEG